MKRAISAVLLLALCITGLPGQEPSYILKRETFKPGPSSLRFSPDGSLLLVGFSDGSFRVLDPESLEPSLEVEEAHSKAVTAMDMPPKMDFILSAGGKQIKLWSRTGRHIGNLSGHATTIWNVDISNDGKYAVSTAFNKTFLLWDVYNGVIAAHMRGHEDVTLAACISPDNKSIASASNDGTIRIWDLESREVTASMHGPTQDVYDIAFSPDGKLLAVASMERSIRVYNLENTELLHILKGHRGPVRKVIFGPGSRFLASASEDGALALWDVVKGERIHYYMDEGDMFLDVAFHPDGRSLYSISRAGNLARREIHPEIFVRRYYGDAYREELASDPIFEARRKGEAKKEFEARQAEAEKQKADIIDRYYQRYLRERDQ
jgi:WD40 repeat protein